MKVEQLSSRPQFRIFTSLPCVAFQSEAGFHCSNAQLLYFFPLAKNTPKGSRTPVAGMRTRYPRPLDDGGGHSNPKF